MRYQTNNKPVIALPIEVKVRELDSKLLLSAHLLSAGYPVMIGSRAAIYREVKFMKNVVLFSKSLSQILIPIFRSIKSNNGKIIVLDEEGGVSHPNKEKETIEQFIPDSLINYIDMYFCIGNSLQNTIFKYKPLLGRDKVHISGNPRFDLLKLKYLPFSQSKINKRKKLFGEYILIPTNFSSGNHYEGDEGKRNYLRKLKDLPSEMLNFKLEYIEWEKSIFQNYLETIKLISFKYPKYSIIVRPHRSENIFNYKKEFKRFRNIHVINEDSSIGWILGAKLVLHCQCTTGIEAFLAGKPVISYIPNYIEKYIRPLPLMASQVVYNEYQLFKQLNNFLDNTNHLKIQNNSIINLKFNIHNFNSESCPIIISELGKHLKNFVSEDDRKKIKEEVINTIIRARNFLRYIYNYFKCKVFHDDIVTHKFPGLRKSEIFNKIKLFMEIENFSLKISIKRKGINAYFIKTK